MRTTKQIDKMIDEMDEAKEVYALILDVLEGGDRALDFENDVTTATTIRIIAKLAGDAYDGLVAHQKLLGGMRNER